MASLQTLAAQHRQAILAREAAAGAHLDGQFRAAWARIFLQLQQLFTQMKAAEDSGQTIDIAWLYQANRLQKLLAQIHCQVAAFADQANQNVQSQMSQAQHTGAQDARLLLDAKVAKLGVAFKQPQPQALQALAQSLDSGRVAQRFNQMPLDAARRAKGTLLYGIAQGWGPRQIASKLQYDLSIQLRDALRISRTESMQSYRAGTLSIYRANADVVTGWEWLAAGNPCPECAAMNGTRHSLDESMDTHPNCRCTQLPITVSFADLGYTGIEEAA